MQALCPEPGTFISFLKGLSTALRAVATTEMNRIYGTNYKQGGM